MIDTHCHIDLFDNPMEIANECESLGIITIGMTNLPSHFEMGYRHLRGFKKVRLALGLHPLHPGMHNAEFPGFLRNIDNTSYIGEIGLDYSKIGILSKDKQLSTFNKILESLSGKNKILSLHSRKAEKDVLELLNHYKMKSAIFHWYTGPLNLIEKIIESGFYFSVNPAMIKTKSGQAVISKIPLRSILTESDGPFIENNGVAVKPKDVALVIKYLSQLYHLTEQEISNLISNNFNRLLDFIIKK